MGRIRWVNGMYMLIASTFIACGGVDSDAFPKGETVRTESTLIGGEQAEIGAWDSTIFIVAGTRNPSGCSAARVGPRHILTAAHCVQSRREQSGEIRRFPTLRGRYATGQTLLITNDKVLNDATWFAHTIVRTEMHPSWREACTPWCLANQSTVAPFASDLALITVEEDLDVKIPAASVDFWPVRGTQAVTVVGYGCELSVGASTGPQRLKFENVFSETPLKASMRGAYVATPGKDQDASAASLCPGDSGGPLYRGHDGGVHRVVGVNAYYFFHTSVNGVAWQNLHTGLSTDNRHDVAEWLSERLPESQVIWAN